MQGSQLKLPIILKMRQLNSTRFAGKFMERTVFVDILWARVVMLERTQCSFSTRALAVAIVPNQVFRCKLVHRIQLCLMDIHGRRFRN